MEKLLCLILGHKTESHLDYIYGTLPREHGVCKRCNTTTIFERPTESREKELTLIDCF